MGLSKPIAIVAEEQDFCRAGITAMLQRHFSFGAVFEVRSLDDLIVSLETNSDVSLVTIDLGLPGLSAPQGLRTLRERFPRVRLVVITRSTDRHAILLSLSAGIHGFIPKALQSADVITALQMILDGHIFIPAALTDLAATPVAADNRARAPKPCENGLTHRQREVLDLLSEGRSNKEIARILRIAEGTVKVHVNAAFRTLGVHNRVSAAAAFHSPDGNSARVMSFG